MIHNSIEIMVGSILDADVEAIVNAANSSLLGGGGVDGVIHRAAGPKLAEQCAGLGGAEAGQAKITGAHNLPFKHIIHAVGPIWKGGLEGEPEVLASCYQRSLELAAIHDCRSVAFPAISTGAYAYPRKAAAEVALRTVADTLQEFDGIRRCVFVFIDKGSATEMRRLAERMMIDVH